MGQDQRGQFVLCSVVFTPSPPSHQGSVLVTEYVQFTDCQAFFPVVQIGTPTPHPQGSNPPPQFRRRDIYSGTLFYYNPSTVWFVPVNMFLTF